MNLPHSEMHKYIELGAPLNLKQSSSEDAKSHDLNDDKLVNEDAKSHDLADKLCSSLIWTYN